MSDSHASKVKSETCVVVQLRRKTIVLNHNEVYSPAYNICYISLFNNT